MWWSWIAVVYIQKASSLPWTRIHLASMRTFTVISSFTNISSLSFHSVVEIWTVSLTQTSPAQCKSKFAVDINWCWSRSLNLSKFRLNSSTWSDLCFWHRNLTRSVDWTLKLDQFGFPNVKIWLIQLAYAFFMLLASENFLCPTLWSCLFQFGLIYSICTHTTLILNGNLKLRFSLI